MSLNSEILHALKKDHWGENIVVNGIRVITTKGVEDKVEGKVRKRSKKDCDHI